MVMFKQDARRRVVARAWTRVCYDKQQRLPGREDGQKPSEVRLPRDRLRVRRSSRTNNACGLGHGAQQGKG